MRGLESRTQALLMKPPVTAADLRRRAIKEVAFLQTLDAQGISLGHPDLGMFPLVDGPAYQAVPTHL
jgi:hypothetical protein